MAKCSQCLHWDVCSMLFEMAIGRKPTANGNKAEEKCPHFKDKTINTNADRIRAMSDEELALALRAIINTQDCPMGEMDCDDCFFKEFCWHGSEWYGNEIEWLKQPAEVDKDA